jgi:hypothetical protein
VWEQVWVFWRKENVFLLSTFNPRSVQCTAWSFFPTGYYGVIKINNASCIKGQIGRTSIKYTGVWPSKFAKVVGKNKRGQCTCQHNTEARSLCLKKKYVLHILSVVFVALGIQHVMRMRRILLSCQTVPYFPTLSHN